MIKTINKQKKKIKNYCKPKIEKNKKIKIKNNKNQPFTT